MSRAVSQAQAVFTAEAAIVHHARECESALRCAATAAEAGLSAGLAEGLHKLAAYHSDHAFAWARRLPAARGGAA